MGNSLLSSLVDQVVKAKAKKTGSTNTNTAKRIQERKDQILELVTRKPWMTVREISKEIGVTYYMAWSYVQSMLGDTLTVDRDFLSINNRPGQQVKMYAPISMVGTRALDNAEFWNKIKERYSYDERKRKLIYKDRPTHTFRDESAAKRWRSRFLGKPAGYYDKKTGNPQVWIKGVSQTVHLDDPRILELDRVSYEG